MRAMMIDLVIKNALPKYLSRLKINKCGEQKYPVTWKEPSFIPIRRINAFRSWFIRLISFRLDNSIYS